MHIVPKKDFLKLSFRDGTLQYFYEIFPFILMSHEHIAVWMVIMYIILRERDMAFVVDT